MEGGEVKLLGQQNRTMFVYKRWCIILKCVVQIVEVLRVGKECQIAKIPGLHFGPGLKDWWYVCMKNESDK